MKVIKKPFVSKLIIITLTIFILIIFMNIGCKRQIAFAE